MAKMFAGKSILPGRTKAFTFSFHLFNLILSIMIYALIIDIKVPNNVKHSSMNSAYMVGKVRWTVIGV